MIQASQDHEHPTIGTAETIEKVASLQEPSGMARQVQRNPKPDKAYDADWLRAMISAQGVWANIPPKSNRRNPVCFSPLLYKKRNLIERFFNKLKYFRWIATRYDKLGTVFLAMAKLACIRLRLRHYESMA